MADSSRSRKKGRGATMTHDYKRNGTTTLFAALDVATGKVIGSFLPKHRHIEFLKFLRTIEKNVPGGLQIHLILDYLAAHNDEPTPLVWTATADSILEKVARGRVTLPPPQPKLRQSTSAS